ncbi:hypothetical protein [Streptomyces sp. NPDC048623]|uniref:hypothetical protein n=1 Tax=Streptomyces sp. NPDC048623 TaxID=3155761 RepID=UPI0034458090
MRSITFFATRTLPLAAGAAMAVSLLLGAASVAGQATPEQSSSVRVLADGTVPGEPSTTINEEWNSKG